MSPKPNKTKLSPLAPTSFPEMPGVDGVLLAAGACGLKKNDKSDLMFVVRYGLIIRALIVGSVPVDLLRGQKTPAPPRPRNHLFGLSHDPSVYTLMSAGAAIRHR